MLPSPAAGGDDDTFKPHSGQLSFSIFFTRFSFGAKSHHVIAFLDLCSMRGTENFFYEVVLSQEVTKKSTAHEEGRRKRKFPLSFLRKNNTDGDERRRRRKKRFFTLFVRERKSMSISFPLSHVGRRIL